MTSLVERTIRTQKENLRKVHNVRFIIGDTEYKLTYVGGLSEYIAIDARKVGHRNFKCANGFAGYKFYTAEDAIEHAKKLVSENL